MAITSVCVTPEDRYELDDALQTITKRKIGVDGHGHPLTRTPTASNMIELACSDNYIFVLHVDGSVYRRHVHSENYHQLTDVPLGVTSIVCTQSEIQYIHGAGSAVSACPLPGDSGLYLTDTAGINDIKSVVGDERQRIILLNSGTCYVQQYHRAAPDLLTLPPNIAQVEIAQEFFYFRTTAGEIYRIKDAARSGPDPLAGITGATVIAISSDHVDRLWIYTAAGSTSVTPNTWIGNPPPPTGWVYGVGTTSGNEEWVVADWVEVA